MAMIQEGCPTCWSKHKGKTMTDREKLIQIIDSSRTYVANKENLADHLIANGVTIPVLCKDCKYGVWCEEEQLWECVVGADVTGDVDTYAMFHEYNKADHFCSYGERKNNHES